MTYEANNPTVLVTGGTGLVGSYIISEFLAQHYKVIATYHRTPPQSPWISNLKDNVTWVSCDILDTKQIETLISEVKFVIHAAAMVSFAPKDTAKMYQINIQGTANVVNACLQHHKRLCFISSIAALGRNDNNTTIDETQKWENSELNSEYAKTKYLAELEVWRGEAEGLDMVILNPSLVLGIADWNRSSTQLFKYVFEQKNFYTQGTLNYVDARDVAHLTYKLTISPVKSERFIVNAGKVSYQDFFVKIAQQFSTKPPSYKISPFLAQIAWRWFAFLSFFTQKPPLITRETAALANKSFYYKNDKIKNMLSFQFRNLDESIAWVCEGLKKHYLKQ